MADGKLWAFELVNRQFGQSELIQAEGAVIKLTTFAFMGCQVSSGELVVAVLADHGIWAAFSFVFVEVIRQGEWISAELAYLRWFTTLVLVLRGFRLGIRICCRLIAVCLMLFKSVNWLFFLTVSAGSRATCSTVLSCFRTWHRKFTHGTVIVWEIQILIRWLSII